MALQMTDLEGILLGYVNLFEQCKARLRHAEVCFFRCLVAANVFLPVILTYLHVHVSAYAEREYSFYGSRSMMWFVTLPRSSWLSRT